MAPPEGGPPAAASHPLDPPQPPEPCSVPRPNIHREATKMSDVRIEYCVPCGFRERALDVQGAVLNALEPRLDSLTLEMGDQGVFRVSVDGEVVWNKTEDEFDLDDIPRRVRPHL